MLFLSISIYGNTDRLLLLPVKRNLDLLKSLPMVYVFTSPFISTWQNIRIQHPRKRCNVERKDRTFTQRLEICDKFLAVEIFGHIHTLLSLCNNILLILRLQPFGVKTYQNSTRSLNMMGISFLSKASYCVRRVSCQSGIKKVRYW